MSVSLLDVNVLIALFDSSHEHHGPAHRWLARNRSYGWATCPITTNGCVRILSNPAYRARDASPAEVALRLKEFTSAPDHHFWPDSISILDANLFRVSSIGGHRSVTDAYLLGLAVRNHGRLVTFDRGIPIKAVPEAKARNLVVIEAA
ncbi:MAG: PIN domain-containing protein [Acidobacteriaceae bacterium]|nr:PIN domain-containing protein [Acidobacteriaceae bacterium]